MMQEETTKQRMHGIAANIEAGLKTLNSKRLKWQFDKYLILESEQREKRYALKWVLSAGVLITFIKVTAYILTNSNAILSDVLESLINMAASTFSLYSLHYAGRPRDSKHPFGHGKMEYLAATVEGTLIFGAGAVIIGKALYNLFYPQAIQGVNIGIFFVAAAAAGNFLLGTYLKNRGKKLDSLVLQSDGKRILADALSSLGLLVALGIILLTRIAWFDSLIAIFSGILIIRTGYKIIGESIKGLLDEADNETLEEVVRVLQNNSKTAWIDIENLKAMHHGMYVYIHCHMTMPWYWNLQKVHEHVKEAELIINQHFKERVELFVQAEPCQPRHCSICRIEDCEVRHEPYHKRSALKIHENMKAEQRAAG